ncbi:MAG TPA: hypothetical protein V6C78_21060 [Crinalium sp.]
MIAESVTDQLLQSCDRQISFVIQPFQRKRMANSVAWAIATTDITM